MEVNKSMNFVLVLKIILLVSIMMEGIPSFSANKKSIKTLNKLVNYGLRHNKEILIMERAYLSKKKRIGALSGFPDPTIGGNIFTREIETKNGPQTSNIKISQKLPWFGKLSSMESKEEFGASSLKWQLADLKLKVKKRITLHYIKVLKLASLINLNIKHSNLVNELYEITLKKIRVGTAKQTSALALSVERSFLTQKKLQLRSEFAKKISALEKTTQINLSAGQFYTEVDALKEFDFKLLKHPYLTRRESLKKNHPALKAKKELENVRFSSLEFARVKAFPDISVNATWYQIKEPDSIIENKDAFSIGATISLPIFGGKYSSLQNSEEETFQQAKIETEAIIDEIQLELDSLVFDLKAKKDILKIYNESIVPSLNQTIEIDKHSYKQGNITINQLIDNLRKKINFDTVLVEEQANIKIIVAKLKRHLYF